MTINFIRRLYKKIMKKSKRYTLAIDLDETCIHSTTYYYHQQQVRAGIVKPENAHMYSRYVVRLRNGVREFIDKAKEKFNLVIYTAAKRCYAEFIRELLDPKKEIFDKVYAREDCINQCGLLKKDLKIINKDVTKVILIDNSLHVFMVGQYGLHVRDFRGHIDNEMLNLWYCLDKLHVHTKMHTVIHQVSKNHNLHIKEMFMEKPKMPQKRSLQETSKIVSPNDKQIKLDKPEKQLVSDDEIKADIDKTKDDIDKSSFSDNTCEKPIIIEKSKNSLIKNNTRISSVTLLGLLGLLLILK